jgi:hypothetical protein
MGRKSQIGSASTRRSLREKLRGSEARAWLPRRYVQRPRPTGGNAGVFHGHGGKWPKPGKSGGAASSLKTLLIPVPSCFSGHSACSRMRGFVRRQVHRTEDCSATHHAGSVCRSFLLRIFRSLDVFLTGITGSEPTLLPVFGHQFHTPYAGMQSGMAGSNAGTDLQFGGMVRQSRGTKSQVGGDGLLR